MGVSKKMEKATITIKFTVGISSAYPTKLDFLRDYLPEVVVKRGNGYNMTSLACQLGYSPGRLSQKMSGAKNSAWSSKDEDKLKLILTAQEYLPIIAYDIESTQRDYNEIQALKERLKVLEEESAVNS